MNHEHTQALRAAMQAHGLTPPATIEWTGKLVRFSDGEEARSRKSGWYVAYPDPPVSAAFGSWRTGEKDTWTAGESPPDDVDVDALRRAWAEQKERRQEELERGWDQAASRCRSVWHRAEPATPDHPYLEAKGVTEATGLRLLQDELLIPMKGTGPGNPLRSLQRISPGGEKRFWEGTHVHATRTTLISGPFDQKGDIYLCEGWATGWTLHHVTGEPVVVAFFASNLEPVATYLRGQYPLANLIVAADNDRWSALHKGTEKETPNPGVTFARRAAEAANAVVAIPDFQDLEGKPTDFNDLWLAQGDEAVLHWARPDVADRATVTPPGDESAPEKEREGDEPPSKAPWLETAPFRVLGYNRGRYYFLPRGTGQIIDFPPSGLDRGSNMYTLAPHSYWETHFQRGNGIHWKGVADALIQTAHRSGVFEPDQIRGRGCWPEEAEDGEQGVILHLGDRLLPPGSACYVKPDAYISPTGYTYENQGRKRGPGREAMSDDEAAALLKLYRDFLWNEPASGDLLAGWAVLAPICGALPWRPHVWITGERGCGKSTILRDLLQPCLGDLHLPVVGNTTEAGVRQELRTDAFPVSFDEAEEDETTGRRIQGVLALARQASSESDARTLKGTVHGSSLHFRIRSMFCFASIGGAVYQEADRSRISMLHLRGASQVSAMERKMHWQRVQPRLMRVTEKTGRRLIARTMGFLRSGVLLKTVETFRAEAGQVLGDQRTGDQYGTLYAGSWLLMANEPPGRIEAREIVGGSELDDYREDQVPEGIKALQILMQQRERVESSRGSVTLSVGELVDIARGQIDGSVSADAAGRMLGQMGFRVEARAGSYVLLIANTSEWVQRALRGTIYARGIRTVLRSLPDVEPEPTPVRFHTGFVARASSVPFYLLDGSLMEGED